jgi:N-carbamoylputrescine amidase
MKDIVRAGLIQTNPGENKKENIDKTVAMIEKAASEGALVLSLQELFYSPYFASEQNLKWFDWAEPNDGPIIKLMQSLAVKHKIVLVVPFFEEVGRSIFYNTAAVIDIDGKTGFYRKNHIPHLEGFWEKFYFKPGNLGYPVFDTAYGKIGVYICYDRHFPEGARMLALNGAEIVFNPSATVDSLSRYLWELEQPAHAVANMYYVGAINRVGYEPSLTTEKYFGSSYFANPKGQIIKQGSSENEDIIIADLDLNVINETRKLWQFYRDRRPETYSGLTKLLP